jgi:transcriptional regulator GlxA family with amidase domain
MAFLADARIDAVRRYLEATEQSMKEIANQCGFDSADSLRRVFVKRLAISPVEYRQRFRSGASTNAAGAPEAALAGG